MKILLIIIGISNVIATIVFINRYFFYKKEWLDIPYLSKYYYESNIVKLVILTFEDFIKDYSQDFSYYSFSYNSNHTLKHPIKTYKSKSKYNYNIGTIERIYIIQFPNIKEYIKFNYWYKNQKNITYNKENNEDFFKKSKVIFLKSQK